ncbi:MAG: TetR/AcrR family transcriptional regulator, partial [Caulobacteraceae bacterium]
MTSQTTLAGHCSARRESLELVRQLTDWEQALPDKRDRLVEAAADLAHRRGFRETSLAAIAEAAGVPLGNVYYYFKTKDALAEALIERW